MKKYNGPQSTSTQVNDQFKRSAWPAIFGNWAVIAKDSQVSQKELTKQWQDQINGIEPFFIDDKMAYVNSDGRELLKAMGLVQVRKLPIRDKIGFALFAPEQADYDTFASRVEFTEPGIALLTDTAEEGPTYDLLIQPPATFPEQF